MLGYARSKIFLKAQFLDKKMNSFSLFATFRLVEQGASGLLKNFDFYIIPVANPDGYVYTWNGNRMWRKNRRPSSLLLFRSDSRQFWPTQGNFPGFPGFGGTPEAGKGIPGNISYRFNQNKPSGVQGRPYVRKRCILLIVSQLIDGGNFLGSNERYIPKLQNETNLALIP